MSQSFNIITDVSMQTMGVDTPHVMLMETEESKLTNPNVLLCDKPESEKLEEPQIEDNIYNVDDYLNADPYEDIFDGCVEYGFNMNTSDIYSCQFEGGYNDY